MSIADIRQSYQKYELLETNAAGDPFQQFDIWFKQALASQIAEPTAMTLATADPSGKPSARIVLLKEVDSQGFVFYTNYLSRKGNELAGNPWASLLFFWPALERQVRIEGQVDRISAVESDAYYASRPLGSRIGAWASPQSQPMDHDSLAQRARDLAQQLGDNPPRPPHWGGYRLHPHAIEFWQGRPSRLHDRLVYTRQEDSSWAINRLAP